MTENSCRENMHALPWWQPLTHEEAERFFGLGTPRRRSSYRADLPARMTSSWRLRSTRFSTARPRARAGNATSLIGVRGAIRSGTTSDATAIAGGSKLPLLATRAVPSAKEKPMSSTGSDLRTRDTGPRYVLQRDL